MTVSTATVVPFAPPDIGADEIEEVVKTLQSGWLSTGPRVARFEREFAAFTGAEHAVALNSCTAGLHLSLLAAGVGPGDEVITTPFTFCATANVILHVGATPVFADIDPRTGTIDPAAVADAITPRTRAIIPVHYGGRPADVEALSALARDHGLFVIEDAAHCVEGVAAGRKIGTTAPFTCFSFYATKNLTTGEGGMVTTPSAEAADQIRLASLHGLSRDAWARYQGTAPVRYDVVSAGFKYNMTDLQAALGLHQLRAIGRHFQRRRVISARYDEGLNGLPFSRFADVPFGTVHARHLYTVLVDEAPVRVRTAATSPRDALAEALAAQGIASSVHFPPLHLTRFYRERFGLVPGMFPATERIAAAVLSLPLSPALSDAQIDHVIAVAREVYRR